MFVVNPDRASGNLVLDVRCDHCGKDHQLLDANKQQFVVAFPINPIDRMFNPPMFLCRRRCLDAVKKKRHNEDQSVIGWQEWGELTGLFESS